MELTMVPLLSLAIMLHIHLQLKRSAQAIMQLKFIVWLVQLTSFALCKCFWISYQLWSFSKEKNQCLFVNVPQICTTSGSMPQLRWLLKFLSCFSSHSSFWFVSTHQSASKINYLSSLSFTLFWRLWFKLLLQWAISCLVPLILKQQLLPLHPFSIYLWVFSVATWLTWHLLKANGLSKLLNGFNGFHQSDIASTVLCNHNGEMVQMENQCSTI